MQTTARSPLRVLLVDDSPQFLASARQVLGREQLVRLVGAAQSGLEALRLVERLRPDLVLMDLAMPGMNGLEATRRIKQLELAPAVVVLTLYDDAEYREAAAAVGADGFIVKGDWYECMPGVLQGLWERLR